MTILTAKTLGALHAAERLPCSLPLGGMKVDVDPAFIGCIDPYDYEETSLKAANDNREDARAKAQHWRL
jgi:hypothetical protein